MSDWYWRDCLSEAFVDAGIEATDEQIETVASWVDGAHEHYGMATGNDVASQNLRAARNRELEDAKADLKRDREKVTCRVCNGTGQEVIHGPIHSSYSQCWKCNGNGRHDP